MDPRTAGATRGTRAHRSARTRRHHRRIIVVATLAVLLVIEAIATGANLFYQDRALPRTEVAGVKVGGMTRSQIARELGRNADPGPITIQVPGKRLTLDPAKAGISLDADATASRALAQGRGSNPLATLINAGGAAGMELTGDAAGLQRWLDANLDGVTAPVTEPAISYDPANGTFALHPGEAGTRVDAAKLLAELKSRASGAGPITLSAEPVVSAPTVSDAAAHQALERARKLASRDLRLTADGAPAGVVPRSAIGRFLTFTPKGGKLEIGADQDAIATYASTALIPRIDRPAQDEVRITGRRGLTIPGAEGVKVTSPGELANVIAKAIAAGTPKAEIPVAVTQPGKRQVADGARLVEVNLTQQRTYLKVGGKVIRDYVVSSGKLTTPTVQGKFKVWHKTKLQDMRGGSGAGRYHLKDVKWNTFFKGNYGFHTAYWHDDFGTPVSHGCVNMHESDAKAVFDFAPMGTSVWVHE